MPFIRRKLSYANVAATMALVFSMSGGAMAASHYLLNSSKQINPKVLKALTGKAGPGGTTGPTGAPGVAGTTGATGPAGPKGAQGEPGSAGLKGEIGSVGPSGISGYRRVVGALIASTGSGVNLASAEVECPAGTSILGGGFETAKNNEHLGVVADAPNGTELWRVALTSSTTALYEVRAFALCAKVTS